VKTIPVSQEAEQSVLGGLMLDPASLNRIGDMLTDEDFYLQAHRIIFRAITDIARAGRPFDAITIGEAMTSAGTANQAGGIDYLIGLVANTPSAANIRAWAEIVRDKAVQRRMLDVLNVANESIFRGGENSQKLLDSTIRELMMLGKVVGDCDASMKQAAQQAYEDIVDAHDNRGKVRGVPTGYTAIDARLGGFHKGDLVFLGARPSMGKTALMVNLALNASKAGFSVGMISGEQSSMQIAQRSYALTAQVNAEHLRNGNIEDDDWGRLTMATASLVKANVRIYDRSAPTLDEVCRTARRWKQEHGIQVLFVDYLQRITVPKAGNRIEEVSETARGLKTLARDLGIPVVALAQVKAEVDKRTGDKRPGLGDIANSDEATREADQIAFLYRDEVYDRDTQHKGMAELNFEKNRHGPTGRFDLRFAGETMHFTDIPKRDGGDW
jgi:replicative DNA helicase